MAKYHKRSSKIRNFAIGLLNILKETVTFLFSFIIGVLNLIGIIVE